MPGSDSIVMELVDTFDICQAEHNVVTTISVSVTSATGVKTVQTSLSEEIPLKSMEEDALNDEENEQSSSIPENTLLNIESVESSIIPFPLQQPPFKHQRKATLPAGKEVASERSSEAEDFYQRDAENGMALRPHRLLHSRRPSIETAMTMLKQNPTIDISPQASPIQKEFEQSLRKSPTPSVIRTPSLPLENGMTAEEEEVLMMRMKIKSSVEKQKDEANDATSSQDLIDANSEEESCEVSELFIQPTGMPSRWPLGASLKTIRSIKHGFQHFFYNVSDTGLARRFLHIRSLDELLLINRRLVIGQSHASVMTWFRELKDCVTLLWRRIECIKDRIIRDWSFTEVHSDIQLVTEDGGIVEEIFVKVEVKKISCRASSRPQIRLLDKTPRLVKIRAALPEDHRFVVCQQKQLRMEPWPLDDSAGYFHEYTYLVLYPSADPDYAVVLVHPRTGSMVKVTSSNVNSTLNSSSYSLALKVQTSMIE